MNGLGTPQGGMQPNMLADLLRKLMMDSGAGGPLAQALRAAFGMDGQPAGARRPGDSNIPGSGANSKGLGGLGTGGTGGLIVPTGLNPTRTSVRSDV